jgi:hypothetical protein
LTARPLNTDGTWQNKTEKEYLCVCKGEEKGLTAAEFMLAQLDGWEKQYQYLAGKEKVFLPPSAVDAKGLERISKHPKATRYGRQNPICAAWNSEERLEEWRESWAYEVNHALAKHDITDRIDHRSHAKRGLEELPTVHEGVAARAMENRNIVADRCELNREIRANNHILRELKAKLDKLLQTIPQIAEALENIHSRLIVFRYQILGVAHLKRKHNNWLDKALPVIDQYNEIIKKIKVKSTEQKELQVERDKCTTFQLIKKHDLTFKIDTIREEIEDLKSDKGILISRLGCANDNEVRAEEKSLQIIQEELPSLDRREAEITQKEKLELEQYKDISSCIDPLYADDVWDARAELRPGKTANVETVLRNGYGDKFDHSRYGAAKREICDELGEGKFNEAALSVRRRQRIGKEVQKIPDKHWNRHDISR